MKGIIAACLKKELRETLRDKRTLFLTIVMPLVFYPAMLGLNLWMQEKQAVEVQQRGVNVALLGAEKLVFPADDWVSWSHVDGRGSVSELLSSYDAVVDVSYPTRKGIHEVAIHCSDQMLLRGADKNLRTLIEDVTAKKLESDLVKAGVGEGEVARFQFVSRDSEAVVSRESYGGVGAYFLVFLAFTGCMAVAVDTASGEKERGTLEAVLATPAPFVAVAAGKLVYIVTMGLLSVISTLSGLMLLVYVAGEFDHQSVELSQVLSGGLLLVLMVSLFATWLFACSIMARSSKEAHLRSVLLMFLVAMLLVYSTLPGVEVKGAVMWVPVLNIALALRGIWSGDLAILDYFQVALITSLLALASLVVIAKLVRRNPEKALLKA